MKKTIQIIEQKNQKQLQVTRLTVYDQAKVVEAINDHHETYYLFFFKDTFLTGKKATKIKRSSFLASAFKKGITFLAPHPVIEQLLQPYATFKFSTFNKLLPELKRKYSNQETALQFMYFDNFIKKEKLTKLIQQLFYEYRRNGQLKHAYHILRLILHFNPKNTWANDLASSLQFQKYKTNDNDMSTLLKNDPLLGEIKCFTKRHNPSNFQHLISLYKAENRLIELLALHLDHMKKNLSINTYQSLMELLHKQYNSEQLTQVLQQLYTQTPDFEPLQLDLYTEYMNTKRYNEAVNLLSSPNFPLTTINKSKVRKLFIQDLLQFEQLNTKGLSHLLLTFFNDDPVTLEKLTKQCAKELLQQHEPNFIKQWLEPLQNLNHPLPTIQKVDKLSAICDDPEKQGIAGELYCEFGQIPKAIECFKWEMELRPTDIKPVQSLSNLYSTLGMKEEANAYQQILMTMKKSG